MKFTELTISNPNDLIFGKAISMIQTAMDEGRLKNDEKEYIWIDTIRQDLETIPSDEGQFIEEMIPFIDGDKIILAEYGL